MILDLLSIVPPKQLIVAEKRISWFRVKPGMEIHNNVKLKEPF